MTDRSFSRRALLGSGAVAGLGLVAGTGASAGTGAFVYEVTRSEADWRARLSPEEYAVLRDGETEWPTTSPLWNDYRAGEFLCRGCGLHVYSSAHRAPVEKGWVFFFHAVPRAVLTDIDTGNPYAAARDAAGSLIETHCRRCGGHMGHVVVVDGMLVHCINGASLDFRPVAA